MKRIVVILLAVLATAFGASAQGTVTRGPLEFTFTADIADPLAHNAELLWNGVNQLYQLWFWYRCPGDSMETPMPIPDQQTYAPDNIALYWNDMCGDTALVVMYLYDCSSEACQYFEPGPWGQISVYFGSTTPPPQAPTVFIYYDFDVAASSGGDTASFVATGAMRIRDGNATVDQRNNGDYFGQVAAWPILRDALNDASPTNLDGSGLPFGPGDFTGATQGEGWISLFFEIDNPFLLHFSDGFESGDASAWSATVP